MRAPGALCCNGSDSDCLRSLHKQAVVVVLDHEMGARKYIEIVSGAKLLAWREEIISWSFNASAYLLI